MQAPYRDAQGSGGARCWHGMGMGNRRVQPVAGNLGKPPWVRGARLAPHGLGRGKGGYGDTSGDTGMPLGMLGASRLCPACRHPTVPGVSLEGAEGPSPEPPHGGLGAAWDHVGAA